MTTFKSRVLLVLLSSILGAIVLLSLSEIAKADGPTTITHQFYGTVNNNGTVVGAGYTVYAVVNGQQVASTKTDSQGGWGYSQQFLVTAPSDSFIEFYVNGVLAGKAASCISANKLDLVVTGAPPPSSFDASAAKFPTNSASSTAPSPPSTVASGVTVISCSILGKLDSFTVSNGVLVSPKDITSTDAKIRLGFAANTSLNLHGSQQLIMVQLVPAPSPPENSRMLAAYSFGPDNSTFNPPLTLIIKYEASGLPQYVTESNLYIAQFLSSNDWIALPSSVDTNNKTVSAQISHFSIFALLGRPSPPLPPSTASFTVTGLSIVPDTVEVGEKVTIEINMHNSGNAPYTRNLVLNVNGKIEGQKEITLPPGMSQVINFTISKDKPGAYVVSVDSSSASFNVKTPSPEPLQTSSNPVPVIAVIAIAVLLVIILIIVIKRRASGY